MLDLSTNEVQSTPRAQIVLSWLLNAGRATFFVHSWRCHGCFIHLDKILAVEYLGATVDHYLTAAVSSIIHSFINKLSQLSNLNNIIAN